MVSTRNVDGTDIDVKMNVLLVVIPHIETSIENKHFTNDFLFSKFSVRISS